ncbi:MAG: PilN domain-containing protein [Acidobacteria bacterium]|nr:PilN domain-containing protein [Acidobacteriota bacterium]
MIRINLMAVERDRPKRRVGIDLSQQVTVACGLIFVAAIGLVGWQVMTLRGDAANLEAQMLVVDQELATMANVVDQRNEFEARGAELSRRVALVESLRGGQGGLVRMLDQVSRSLPEGVWLNELRQEGDVVTIQGRATGLTGLSDFVLALESSGFFVLPVDIVDSQLESQETAEVVRFELRAEFRLPTS